MTNLIARKIILVFLSLFCVITISSQTIDEKVHHYLQCGDYLALNDLKDNFNEISSPLLVSLSNAFLDIAFNKPLEATESIKKLLEFHQHELGGSMLNILFLFAEQLSNIGNNKDAADLLGLLVSQVDKPDSPEELVGMMKSLHRKYNALSQNDIPLFNVTEGVVTVPFLNTENEYVFVEGSISTIKTQIMIDSGSSYSMMSKDLASKCKATIVSDSILISGIKTGYAQIGFIDELYIGELCLKNMLFYIVDDIMPKDIREKTGINIETILGTDVMRKLGCLSIDFKDKKMSFNSENNINNAKRNMMLWSGSLYTDSYIEKAGRAILLLDTGDITSGTLDRAYFESNISSFENLSHTKNCI